MAVARSLVWEDNIMCTEGKAATIYMGAAGAVGLLKEAGQVSNSKDLVTNSKLTRLGMLVCCLLR